MASREKTWNIEVEGVPYKIELKKNKISINGNEPVKLGKLMKKSSFWETNYSIMLEGKEALLHVRQFGEPVLSYDGRDCATGEEFVPLKTPGWLWVFIILHALNFFLLIGGAIGAVIQVLVITAMGSVAANKKKSIGVRVLACVGIWLLSTVVQFVLAVGMASLLY